MEGINRKVVNSMNFALYQAMKNELSLRAENKTGKQKFPDRRKVFNDRKSTICAGFGSEQNYYP